MSLSGAQRRALLAHPAGWIAAGFGSGLSPVAPGTAGSLAAVLLWFALRELPWPVYVAVIACAFVLGIWACAWVVSTLRDDDPGFVVWDEFVGQWIALAPLAWIAFAWWWPVVAFALFRVFDIAKPWPVSWADRQVKGGLGVMLDDVLAGIYAAAAVTVLTRLVG
ncbi:MAG: phosphatidylglycerophosphatase A [Rudaea sp.]|uniref:phosphatidylglycerophosphatase A family protein n=1 Tax=unclassified Rudaea TaxID=2627037 RepID=UPI0010F9A668|nr:MULTISPECIES: phosphatidylglycerophosphatase A [unclassified Rudaea]MBN8885853.1 phosphatidylglycerophosphatase A [Rudaea sp.]MBR0346973.1 phosphatidylglycerophosphatase A [Rudaea sp.]